MPNDDVTNPLEQLPSDAPVQTTGGPDTDEPPPDGAAARIAALERDLAAARGEVESLARRARVERALHEAGAIDTAAASAQVHGALGDAPADEARIKQEVARLKARRPGLFGAPARVGAPSAMGGVPAPGAHTDSRAALAARARAGDRTSLIAYMRARRAR